VAYQRPGCVVGGLYISYSSGCSLPSSLTNGDQLTLSPTPQCIRSSTRRPPYRHSSAALASATSTKMSTTKLNRLRCTQCSKTFSQAKLLNRHQRETHFQGQRWPCDYPGCSVDFQCLRFKTEHMKKQHARRIAHGLEPAVPSGRGFQQDMPGIMVPSPYESPYAEIAPQLPITVALETPRLPFSPTVDEDLSTRTVASAYESSPRPYDSFDAPASFQEQRGIGVNDPLRHSEHPRRLGADRTKPFSGPAVAPPREPLPDPTLDALGNTSEVRKTFAESETATEGIDDSGIEHTQAIITSIWDRDLETLSRIVDELDIDSEFGEAATGGLVERLLQETTRSVSQRRESREALANRWIFDFTPILRTLTPVRLAILVGFLDGVICLSSRESRPHQDLVKWWKGISGSVPKDNAIGSFLSYNSRGPRLASSGSHESFSSGLLNRVRDELALCCPNPNNDMPGGMKWLEHAIRRGNLFGALVLLQRGADRNTTLADGTAMVDLALENGQDEHAVLLLKPWLLDGSGICDTSAYRHKVLGSSAVGRDFQDASIAVLMRLKYAAEAMKSKVEVWMWRDSLETFIDTIILGVMRILQGVDVDHQSIEARLWN
jgi:hypothetical protein